MIDAILYLVCVLGIFTSLLNDDTNSMLFFGIFLLAREIRDSRE